MKSVHQLPNSPGLMHWHGTCPAHIPFIYFNRDAPTWNTLLLYDDSFRESRQSSRTKTLEWWRGSCLRGIRVIWLLVGVFELHWRCIPAVPLNWCWTVRCCFLIWKCQTPNEWAVSESFFVSLTFRKCCPEDSLGSCDEPAVPLANLGPILRHWAMERAAHQFLRNLAFVSRTNLKNQFDDRTFASWLFLRTSVWIPFCLYGLIKRKEAWILVWMTVDEHSLVQPLILQLCKLI